MAGQSGQAQSSTTILMRAAVGLLTFWVTGISTYLVTVYGWQQEVTGNRWTSNQQNEFRGELNRDLGEVAHQIRQEIAALRSEINSTLERHDERIDNLPPPDVERRIQELEKWRINELERRRSEIPNDKAKSLTLNE